MTRPLTITAVRFHSKSSPINAVPRDQRDRQLRAMPCVHERRRRTDAYWLKVIGVLAVMIVSYWLGGQ